MILKNLTKFLFVVFIINAFFVKENVTVMAQGLSLSFNYIEDMPVKQLISFESMITKSLMEKQKRQRLNEISNEELLQLLNDLKVSEFTITNELFTRGMLISDISFKFISLPELKGSFSELEKEIKAEEVEFLKGSQKGLDFLQSGYDKLKSLDILGTELGEFDNKLQNLYELTQHSDICRDLAERYKELAISSQSKDHYFKAAFWFRLLYSIGAHSSYFEEYKTMILNAKKGIS